MICLWCPVIICFVELIASMTIEVPDCSPPDYPAGGGYGPRQDRYFAGDIIHYYCDSYSYIGGNFYRRCKDNGDWSGDTPVCDFPSDISYMNQTSTAEPEEDNEASLASDGDRNTCSSTGPGYNEYWMGIFKQRGELMRIMIYMPIGEVAYEVLLLKSDGTALSCGVRRDINNRLMWQFHNCPGPNNRDAIGVKIKSLSPKPLQICELTAHVLTSPTCIDPHLRIRGGRIELDRKSAVLVCNRGYTRSLQTRMKCMRDGEWDFSKGRQIYCLEQRVDHSRN